MEERYVFVYSDCMFVVLGILHAMRMHRIILSSVARSAIQYFFSHYLINDNLVVDIAGGKEAEGV